MSVTRHRTLAICIAVALGTGMARAQEHAPQPTPSTLTVTNCNDSGPGSLRDTLASAASGDTIDLTQLQCSVITLTSGELLATIDDVTISGVGQTITAGGASRVIEHTGMGTLHMSGLVLSDGVVSGVNPAMGGCVRSDGDLYLAVMTVQNCSVASTPGFTTRAGGGGVYSHGTARLVDTRVLGNSATPGASSYAYGRGGGVYGFGGLTLEFSTISGNAVNGGTSYGEGGGFQSRGSVYVDYSTISGNSAPFAAAGMIEGNGVSRIRDSTISGNAAPFRTGGLATFAGLTEVWDSTIAFNTTEGPNSGFVVGAGILVLASNGYLSLRGSIVANNSAAGVEDDVCMNENGDAIVGYKNIVLASNFALPPDTLQVDPMLAPLANNGGFTETHALLPGSPAIDAGGSVVESTFDQRGSGYPRISGPQADIGAYEVQRPDFIFANGFD